MTPTYNLELIGTTTNTSTLKIQRNDNSNNGSTILLQKIKGTLNFPSNVFQNDNLRRINLFWNDGILLQETEGTLQIFHLMYFRMII